MDKLLLEDGMNQNHIANQSCGDDVMTADVYMAEIGRIGSELKILTRAADASGCLRYVTGSMVHLYVGTSLDALRILYAEINKALDGGQA